MRRIIFPLFIIGVCILTFLPAFHLGLFGDDWLAFFRYLQYLGPNSTGTWNHLSYFLTSYGPGDMTMGLLQKIFGYHAFYYQLTSFILRLLAAFSIYPLAFYLTKNRTASFLSILFLAVTTIGIETTNWVFNMPSYVAIIFLNIFLYLYLKTKETNRLKYLSLAGLFFVLAILSQSIRMLGVFPFVLFLELFWIFQDRSRMALKKALMRISFLSLLFIILFWVLSGSPVIAGPNLITQGLNAFSGLFNKGKVDFLLNPVITLGSIFAPETIFKTNKFFDLGLGISILIIWIILLKNNFRNRIIATSLFFSFSLIIFSYLFAWYRSPEAIFFTNHRYLIISSVGVALFLGTLSNLFKPQNSRRFVIFLIGIIILLNIMSSNKFLQEQVKTHENKMNEKIWASLPRIEGVGKSNDQVIFYFEGDGSNDTIIRDVITFGFPPHMMLIYNIKEEKNVPLAFNYWQQVLGAVLKGKSSDKIYAFYLQGRDNLINITDVARKQLELIKADQK